MIEAEKNANEPSLNNLWGKILELHTEKIKMLSKARKSFSNKILSKLISVILVVEPK